MKIARALSESEAGKVQSFILFGGLFTTLAIWTKLEDPVNLPKMFVLVLFAATVLGLTLPALLAIRNMESKNQRIGLGLVFLFFFGLSVSTLMTDVKYTAIFGEFHRNNGFLSYLAMAIFTAAAIVSFTFEGAERYFKFFTATGLVLTLYGFLQATGKDPVNWVILYNPFITTLGNPNFTSAGLGLAGITTLYLLIAAEKRFHKGLYLIGLICNLYILQRSGSIQGVFAFLIGATLILVVKAWTINKKYGLLALASAVIVGSPVALAVINVGPLASKLYQGTIKNRLDYWHAALGMIRDHPFFGVGIDRFGEYYRQYTVQNQVVAGQATDNAHSVYLQILSTGGLLMFLPYILLILFVTYIGARAVFQSPNADKLKIAGILATWVGILAINLVTVDNLGISVWFWITGGVLIAISVKTKSISEIPESGKPKNNSRRISKERGQEFPATSIISFILTITAIVFLTPSVNGSSSLYILKNNGVPASTESRSAALASEAETSYNNPQQLIQLANLALSRSDVNQALSIIERINQLDARSYYGNYFAAVAYEAKGNPTKANTFRETLLELDPWGTANMVQLIKNYLAMGDSAKAREIGGKIESYYPGSQADIDASAILAG